MKSWPKMKKRFAQLFKSRTRDEWTEVFEGRDACVAPVLSLTEAAIHPHNFERKAFVDPAGILQAAPAPRFSRTAPAISMPPPAPGEHTDSVLADYGFEPAEITALRQSNAIT